MSRFAVLLVLAGCVEPAPREPDPWERYGVGGALPPGNVRVRVETYEFAAEDRAAFEMALGYRDPHVAIQAGGLGGTNGLTLFAATPEFAAAFRAESRRFRSRRTWEQFLVVADGQAADFQAVQQRLVPVQQVVRFYSGAVLLQTVAGVVTGSGLSARPRIREDRRVDVELAPWISVQEGAAGRTIRVTELATRVTVEPGRPAVLMALDEARESFASAFLSTRSASGYRRMLQVLIVEI